MKSKVHNLKQKYVSELNAKMNLDGNNRDENRIQQLYGALEFADVLLAVK